MLRNICSLAVACCFILFGQQVHAQGYWLPVVKPSPDYDNGVMLLLSDGSVMVKSSHGGIDTLGKLWDRLTPDAYGSYVNGTWDTMPSMKYSRLYCSSQMLKDGRIYVAGGEYGLGAANAEIFNPVTNTWAQTGALPGGHDILDGNSQLLPDGRVLQAFVQNGSRGTYIYNPATNTYTLGPTALGNHDESAWLKLPDNSILFIDINTRLSERFIPSLNMWVRDDTLPVSLYDPYGYEMGASFLLPDGRAFFIGSPGTTAYYTPSGNSSPGTWSAGPTIPDSMGAPDAAAAMMANGKILCAFSHVPDSADNFPAPTSFYEFDYISNSFRRILAPTGRDTLAGQSYATNMLDLPDGNVLFSTIGSNKYYIYVPGGNPVASGKPIVDNVIKINCDTYMITGRLFNGISQGAAYGDDWQMPTNYPLARLVDRDNMRGDYFYYGRTCNWNRTGVMTGNLPDTAWLVLPHSMPAGSYALEVVANGIASDSYAFTTCPAEGIAPTSPLSAPHLVVYPNPATQEVTVRFTSGIKERVEIRLEDVFGRTIKKEFRETAVGQNEHIIDLAGITKGLYTITIINSNGINTTKIIIE